MAGLGEGTKKPRTSQDSLLEAAIGVAVIATDLLGRIVAWNSGAELMLGYAAAEMAGDPGRGDPGADIRALRLEAENPFPGQARGDGRGEDFASLVARARRGGCDEGDWTCVRKDGERLSLRLAITALHDAAGEIDGFLFTAMDLTRRKRAEDELKASELKYRQLIDNSHDIIYSLSPDGTFLFVGPAWTRMLGHQVSEVENHPFTDFVHPDDQGACMAFLKKVIEEGQRREGIEYRVRHMDGNWRWHTSSACPVRVASGAVAHYDGIARDITERKQAEEALRSSEANLNAILANTTDIIAYYDRERRLVACNPAGEAAYRLMLGTDVSPGCRVIDLLPGAMRESMNANAERVLSGETFTIELRMPVPGGGMRVLESAYHPIRRDGAIEGFMTTTRDVTQRKRADDDLREREKQFKTIFDFAPYSCAVTDLEGRYLMVNRSFGKLWGHSAQDALGRTAKEMGIELESEAERRIMTELASTGALNLTEAEVSYRGKSRTIMISVRPIEFAGKPARLVVTVDITDKKAAEQALKRSEERFRLLLQNSNDMITVIDEAAAPILVDGASEKVLGYGARELIGTGGFDSIHPDDLEAVRKAHLKALDEPGRKQRIEYRVKHKDGRWIWIEVVSNNLMADPAIRGIVLNVRDISERKHAEAEREKLQAQLIQAQKIESVGRLAGGVAHDFNNMLGVILGHVDLALSGEKPSRAMLEHLEEIRKAAERSADLTRQLLAFARKQTIAPKVLDINATVEDMLKMLRRLIGEDIELVWLPGRDAGSVKMDPSQLDQVLANLALNARDAIVGTGRLSIETSRVAFAEGDRSEASGIVPGDYILLAVSDDGCGMDAETRGHLFEPFFTTKGMGKGTGLGLATIFGIVRQNEGFINVYSEPGKGTTFKLYLRRQQGTDNQTDQAVHGRPVTGNETVLVVEDEASIRQVTETMLRQLGYAVVAAKTPGEAIQLARERTGVIDLLLTDVVMPEMNGRQLAEILLSINPGLKSLYVSGYTANVIAHHGVLDEGLAFLEKPFSIEALAAKVREALGTPPAP